MEYDESAAVAYINDALTKNGRTTYPEDEILNIIDMIWDFYEENGLIEISDCDDDDEVSAEEISDYVIRMLKKDKEASVDFDDIPIIVNAELDYEESL